MSLEEKEILSMLKFVNESDYGYLNLENEDFELTAIKKDMDLSDIKEIIIGNNKFQETSKTAALDEEAQPVAENTESLEQQIYEDKLNNKEISSEEDIYTVTAPMVGTFFSKPSPDEDAYVKIGQTVTDQDTVCLIEVMKLFNSVSAGVNGQIEEILVEDGELVEYDQPLLKIKEK